MPGRISPSPSWSRQRPAAATGSKLGGQVAGAGALVGVAGELELVALHDIGGVGEGQAWRGGGSAAPQGIAPGMVEMQVGVDHPAHLLRPMPRGARARPPAGSGRGRRRSRRRRCRGTSGLPCRPARCPPGPVRRGARSGGSAWRAGSDCAHPARSASTRGAWAPRRTSPHRRAAAGRPRAEWQRREPRVKERERGMGGENQGKGERGRGNRPFPFPFAPGPAPERRPGCGPPAPGPAAAAARAPRR